jgi:MoxR-like ATPase
VASSLSPAAARDLRQRVISFVSRLFQIGEFESENLLPSVENNCFRVGSFSLPMMQGSNIPKGYQLGHGTTLSNLSRVMRACALSKPILLEGSPGQGKTTLVMALAKQTGRRVVRINLSEETDMMDLLGADLPVEGGKGGEFQWQDGIFLQALKQGDWVLLDELNLASQSILEGLNSVLDHRASIFVPELNASFDCPSSFRIFACQNPSAQGGGRKGLPKSFLNRFTKVYMEPLSAEDMLFIGSSLYPSIDAGQLRALIRFNEQMHHHTMVTCSFGQLGRPWEFNLRDILRCCQLHELNGPLFFELIYELRLRSQVDRERARRLCETVFKQARPARLKTWSVTPQIVTLGRVELPRRTDGGGLEPGAEHVMLLKSRLHELEAVAECVRQNWMPILVGSAATGKTALVHLLARLTGHTLYTFEMNAGIDTTELLGGFEQLDLAHHRADFLRELDEHIAAACRRDCNSGSKMELSHTVLQLRQTVTTAQKDGGRVQAFTDTEESALRQLIQMVGSSSSPLNDRLDAIQRAGKSKGAAVFEWRDGLLIRALERGDWLLIDNVNFCNPAVLDRLNPLLEPGGELIVNERGLVNGKIRVVVPHKNFRIFLAMDPRNGEISRPMRNRGVEICLLPPVGLAQDDYVRLAASRGSLASNIVCAMSVFHDRLAADPDCVLGQSVNVRDYLAWVDFFGELLRRGASVSVALRSSMEHVYVRTRKSVQQRTSIMKLFADCATLWSQASETIPRFPDVREITLDSFGARAASDVAFCSDEMFVVRSSPADVNLRDQGWREKLVAVAWQAPGVKCVWQRLGDGGTMVEAAVSGASGWRPRLAAKLALLCQRVEGLIDSSSGRTALSRSKLFHLGRLSESAVKSEQEVMLYPLLKHAQEVVANHLGSVGDGANWELAAEAVALIHSLLACGQEATLNRALLMVLWRYTRRTLGRLSLLNDSLLKLADAMSLSMSGQQWELESVLARASRGLAPRSPVQAALAVRLLNCDALTTMDSTRREALMELGTLVLGVPFGADAHVVAGHANAVLVEFERTLLQQPLVAGPSRVLGHDLGDLLPLADVLNLAWEHELMLAPNVSQDRLDSFVQWGVKNCSRAAVDFSAYKILWWMKQDGKDDWKVLKGQCLQEAEFRWLWQLFEGSVSLVKGLGPSSGCLSLFRDVPTLMISRLADTSSVPLNLAGSKLSQLVRLHSLLLTSAALREAGRGGPSMHLELECQRLQRKLDRITSAYASRCSGGQTIDLSRFGTVVAVAIRLGREEEGGAVQRGLAALLSVADERLRECCAGFFSEWLLQEVVSSRCKSLAERVAVANLNVGLFALLLLVPHCAVDPAARFALKATFLRGVVEDDCLALEQRKQLERWLYGATQSDALQQLSEAVNRDSKRLATVEAKVQSRGENAPDFALLHAEIERFVRSFGDAGRIKSVQASVTTEQNVQFQSSASSFLRALHSQYSMYRDVTVPLSTAVLDMRFGMELLSHVRNDGALFSSLVPRLLAVPSCASVVEGLARLVEECATQDVAKLGTGMFVALLKWSELAIAESRPPSASLMHALGVLFRAFAQSWTVSREREEQIKQAKEAAVRYKTSTEHVIETDEQRDERLYRQMFPSYANAFADLAPEDMAQDFAADPIEHSAEAHDDDSDKNAGRLLSSVLMGRSRGSLEEHLLEVCKLHARVFCGTNYGAVSEEEASLLSAACSSSYVAAVHLI